MNQATYETKKKEATDFFQRIYKNLDPADIEVYWLGGGIPIFYIDTNKYKF